VTQRGCLPRDPTRPADKLFDLTRRVVLITGGSRGLGREMAFGAARCGADVVIASRNYESCAATAKEIETATGRAALPWRWARTCASTP
jgi:NAD(P)-dependent dehydrogenase (short-subunit alcohol dehydrogenase family)